MTVWVLHPTGDTISPALQFGNIKYINSRYVYGDELTDDGQLPEAFQDNICRAAAEFDQALDYLLINGDHLQLVAMAAELGWRHALFQVLRWDRHAKGYFPARICPVRPASVIPT